MGAGARRNHQVLTGGLDAAAIMSKEGGKGNKGGLESSVRGTPLNEH